MTLRLSGGRRLRSPPGDSARPTAARVRLAVMNILDQRLPGCRWLDLCCGSGVMACEALRRGARQVVALERDRRVAAVARANLEAVAEETARGRRNPSRVRVVCSEALRWLRQGRTAAGRTEAPFDLIYLDPPYRADLYLPLSSAIAAGGWLRRDGLLIWECDRDNPAESAVGWTIRKRRRYGRTELVFLEPQEPGSDGSAAQGAAAPVLIPGRHEQPDQGDRDQSEHDAAEEGFDHGQQG